jgi:Domain of unknown function (DUF4328)
VESNHAAPLGAPMSAEYRRGHQGWQPIGALGAAASVLIGLVALLAGLRTIALITERPQLALVYALLYLVGLLAAGTVFIIWVRRARYNVSVVAGRRFEQRRTNRFFGASRYVTDVWRASAPDGSGGERLVIAWWVTWLASKFVPWFDRGVADQHPVAVVATVLEIAAAVLAILIIQRISKWQRVSPV